MPQAPHPADVNHWSQDAAALFLGTGSLTIFADPVGSRDILTAVGKGNFTHKRFCLGDLNFIRYRLNTF
jgi:hypothetical protein